MTLKASLILNAVLAAALIFALAAWFGKGAAAVEWKQVAAKCTAAYVKSHGGTLPPGTIYFNDSNDNGTVYVVGYSGAGAN